MELMEAGVRRCSSSWRWDRGQLRALGMEGSSVEVGSYHMGWALEGRLCRAGTASRIGLVGGL